MHRHATRAVLVLFGVGFSAGLLSTTGCGDITDTSTGSLQVITQTGAATAESSVDTDGYTIVVDGAERSDIENSGTVTLDGVSAGERVVELQGLDDNCTTPLSPDTVTVEAGGVAQVSFTVTCWPPPSGRIVFRRDVDVYDPIYRIKAYIYVMNADGTGKQQLTDLGADAGPVWSPDNERIAFSGATLGQYADDKDIWVINADGSGRTNLTQNTFYDGSPAWSPDGSKIAFTSDRDGTEAIYLMNSDGSDVVMLTDAGDTPAWSPDGSRMAFNCGSDVCVMNSDGTEIVNLTNTLSTVEAVGAGSWSPDGEKLLYDTDQNGSHTDIYVMNADGTDPVRLTFSSFDDALGSWSPDGTKIVFTRHGGMASRAIIYYMHTDGTGLVGLTEDKESMCGDFSPFWSRGS